MFFKKLKVNVSQKIYKLYTTYDRDNTKPVYSYTIEDSISVFRFVPSV